MLVVSGYLMHEGTYIFFPFFNVSGAVPYLFCGEVLMFFFFLF